METIGYITLKEDCFVYLPYVKTKINLDVNSLNYSTDALSMIVLYMKRDCRSDEDIALVTNLNSGIIQEVKYNLIKEGLLKQEDNLLTESALKILEIYDVISVFESQLKGCYSNLLLRIVEDNVNEQELVKVIDKTDIAKVIIGKRNLFLETFDGAEELVNKYLKEVKKEFLSEHFEINKRIINRDSNGDIFYLKKKINRLPIVYEMDMLMSYSPTNDNTKRCFTVALPCLQIELNLNNTKTVVCYQEPFKGHIFESTRELTKEPNYAYLKFNADSPYMNNSLINLANLNKFLLFKYKVQNVNPKDLIKQTQYVECYFNVTQNMLGDI